MKKTEKFKIEGFDKNIIVNELTIKEILSIFNQDEKISFDKLLSEELLPKVCNLELSEVYDMTPAELNFVWEKFKEINKVFFGLGRIPAVEKVINQIQKAITDDFLKQYASLLNPAITE